MTSAYVVLHPRRVSVSYQEQRFFCVVVVVADACGFISWGE